MSGRFVSIVFAVGVTVACAPRQAGVDGSSPPRIAVTHDVGRRIEVLFLGQRDNRLHNADEFAPILHAALAPQGINISYADTVGALHPDTLARYDALILYANYETIAPSQEKALLDFVASGKGFLPVHSATECFHNSPAYIALVGGQFMSHGGEEFTADFNFIKADHPILEGLKPFRVRDETYVHQKHNPDRTVLIERVDSAGRVPWAWTRAYGQGRVFYTAYGHGAETWTHRSFHHLLRNAILWAVGPEARQQLKRLAIQPVHHTDVTLPPKYVTDYTGSDNSFGGDSAPPMPQYQEPLEPAEALKHFQVPPGFTVQLFAAEPDVVNPFAMTWDERGRLWVIETDDYPNNKAPLWQGHDRVKILEDTNGDGRADKTTVFADGLSIPTTLTLAHGGVIVGAAPEFLFLKDTTGDDRADIRQVMFSRDQGAGDTHFGFSNLRYGVDNWIWGAVGSGFSGKIGTQEQRFGPGIYRFTADSQFTPESYQSEYLTTMSNNTWGLAFSEKFDVFGSTANGEHSTYMAIPNRSYVGVDGLRGQGRMKLDGHYGIRPNTMRVRQVDVRGGFTAATGHSVYTARSFPEDYWNRVAFVNEPSAHLVHRAILSRHGAGFAEKDGWNLLASDDEWFSPIQADVGPDGAVWVLDWYHFVVQHNTFAEGQEGGKHRGWETSLRGNGRGRIYRVMWTGAKPYRLMTLSKARPKELVAALRHENMFWRMTAQRLLVERGRPDVLDELYATVADRSVDVAGLNSPAVHALWTLHGLGVLDGSNARALEVVRRALTHPAAGVRKNALMVLPKSDAMLHTLLQSGLLKDPDLNVRLTALLTIAELPASLAAGRAVYEVSTDSIIGADEWLPEGVFIAAGRHTDGFLAAYAADIGMAEFMHLAARAAVGDVDSFPDFSTPSLDDSQWSTAELPVLSFEPPPGLQMHQVTWVRREFTVPRHSAGQAAILRLGRIRQGDATFINGTPVGGRTEGEPSVREYTVPAGVLVPGRNVLAVRLAESSGPPVRPDSAGMFLNGEGFAVPLSAGLWKFRVTETRSGNRERSLFAGVPIPQQFLAHSSLLLPLRNLASAATPAPQAPAAAAVADDVPRTDTLRIGVAKGSELRFDRPMMNAKAGRQLQVVFTNTAKDVPHNLVIFDRLKPTEVDKVLSDMLADPKVASRGFVPEGPQVLQRTSLLAPQDSAALRFSAPTEPGDYPYVCSFPGHAATMRGVLHVEK